MSSNIKIAVTPWMPIEQGHASEFCEQAELAESLGFHSFWLPENHFGDQRSMPQPLTLLAAIAARTSRIKLGTTSYLITIRNPLHAAEEVAVLDRLSGGRLILGLGRGVQAAMFKAFDLPTKEKRQRFKANLDIMLNAWAGNAIAQDSNDEDILLAPLPLQQPHPRLWIAAFGPLALSQAGSLALPYLASPIETLETLVKNYAHYHGAVAEHHDKVIETIPVMRTLFVSERPEKVAEIKAALASAKPNGMRDEQAKIDDWTIIGDQAYVRDKMAEYIERLSVSHFVALSRLPGVTAAEQVQSHEQLLKLASDL